MIRPYGCAVDTPHLQRFAEAGVLFRKAFTVNPTCSPSRAALVTGKWPHCNGMIGLCHRGSRLNDPNEHWVHTFKNAGYHTVQVGTQHVMPPESDRGFDDYLEEIDVEATDGDEDENTTRKAVAFIEGEHDSPFFMECGYIRTHRTEPPIEGVMWHDFERSPAGDPRYVMPPPPLPDHPETRRDWADFKEAVRQLDGMMGRVIRAVDSAGLADETLMIVTTDHGIAFPGMKCNLTDAGIGVMLMIRGPGGFDGGNVYDAMVTHMDIFPTACEVADIDAPDRLQGYSLCPLVQGKTAKIRDEVFAEVNYHAAYEPKRAVRTERYKYIRRYEVLDHPVLPNCDDSVTKSLYLRHGWNECLQAEDVLYDLAFDPYETCNIARNPESAHILKRLRPKLEQWMKEKDDPLASGDRVPPWPGMKVNPTDGTSPGDPTQPA